MKKPLTPFFVWVFVLSALWGGTLNSQNFNLTGSGEMNYLNSDRGKSIIIDSLKNIDTVDFLDNTTNFDKTGSFGLKATRNDNSVTLKSSVFCPGAPKITSFSPTYGRVGTIVTINGTDFDPIPAVNIVFFGATRATVSAATTTSLTVIVPFGATYQYITVTTSCNLTGYSAQPFIVTFPCGVLDNNSFAPKVDFSAGQRSQWVSIGDMDGDGKADMVVANGGDQTISVLRNTGASGTISFAPKIDFTTGTEPYYVAIGDLDGDGKLDLAIPNYFNIGNSVSVFRNTSTPGNISLDPKIDFTTGNNAATAAIGDIDGDGKPDLIVVNWSSYTFSVLRNTSSVGLISFAPAIDFPTGTNPFGLSIGDLDADGKPDLAIANANSSTFSVYRNISTSGSILFSPRVDFPTSGSSYDLTMGDLDGDGKPDLAVSNLNPNTVSVFRNTGTSGTISFAPKVDLSTGAGPYAGVSINDLDGDGKPDLAVPNFGASSISLFKNTGTSGTISFAPKIDFGSGNRPLGFDIGDLDGDGKPDLALSNLSDGSVSVLRNTIFSPIPLVSISVVPSGTICSGTPIIFTATPVNGGPTPSYQWQVNGVIVVGANLATYTSSTLANGDIVSVIMTSSDPCATPTTATATATAVSIIPSVTPAVTIAAAPTTICPGTLVTFIASPINGGTSPLY
ncbi:MAG: FG-GAP-like repeat-containing protein, partial [Bacteroidota bacterium]|nr:FG-GAP-like repeat-containing protein [Bacteroidota bacterium]